MKKIVYRIFLIVVFILRNLPKSLRRGFFRFLSYCGYLFAKKTNKIVETNLNFIFNYSLTKNEIKEIQKYSYFNMLLWPQSLIENLDISDEELKRIVQIENADIILNLKKENKPIILISAHYGNIEMLSCYINRFVTPLHQVARESNFEEIDEFIVKAREASGSKIIFRSGAIKKLVKALMKKELKFSSYVLWRKRVESCTTKHSAKRVDGINRFKCSLQRAISNNKISKRR